MCECRNGFPPRVPASASVMPTILPRSYAPRIWPPVWCATTKIAEGTAMCAPQICFSRRTQVSYSASDSQWRISISCAWADDDSADAFISCARPREVVAASRDSTILPCARVAGRRDDGLRRARLIPSTENASGICDLLFSARFRDRRREIAPHLPRRKAGRRLLLPDALKRAQRELPLRRARRLRTLPRRRIVARRRAERGGLLATKRARRFRAMRVSRASLLRAFRKCRRDCPNRNRCA